MASNADKIINRYGDGSREENRSSGGRGDYVMEYKYTKRILDRYIDKECSVLEIGCGTGYYGMYLANKCKEYVGVDITSGNIEKFKNKIESKTLSNVKAFVGDATNLGEIKKNDFDVVLVFGPMYHLPEIEREKVFCESKRICKDRGIIMVAYINKIGVYMSGCLDSPEIYPNRQKNDSILKAGIDDTRDDIYWFTMPEDIQECARKNGLSVIENLGVDFALTPEMFNQQSQRQDIWDEINDFLCSSQSCTGFANHAVMICRKTI